MNDQEKIEHLTRRLYIAEGRLLYLGQLRPLLSVDDKYSRAISFEEMSEYAIKWMEQEGLFK